jgi:hypothetical protein
MVEYVRATRRARPQDYTLVAPAHGTPVAAPEAAAA